MPAVADLQTVLQTVIQNTSGAKKSFSFLGAHGMRLGIDEVVTLRGDVAAQFGGLRSPRKFNSLQNALVNGDLAIRSKPAPVLFATDEEETKAVLFHDGSLELVTPAYS